MLERTAGCLESGSLRRLLPASQKSLKSRRSLHSGFWNHGGGDIELSPLWETLMRGAAAAAPPSETQQHNDGSGQTGLLLEFLYPAGTINLIRQYANLGADRLDGRRPRALIGKLGHRQYTSSAKDTDGPVMHQLVDTNASPGSNNGTNSSGTEDWLSWFKNAQEPSAEEAWRRYAALRIPERTLDVQSHLMRLLSSSTRILDAERTIETFESLSLDCRNAILQGSAIQAYLRLRNHPRAIQLQKDALSRFSHSSDFAELSVAFSKLLTYLLQHSLWLQAVELWKDSREKKLDYKIWFHATELSTFPQLAAGLVRHVDKLLRLDENSHTSKTTNQTVSIGDQQVTAPNSEGVSSSTDLQESPQTSEPTESLASSFVQMEPVEAVKLADQNIEVFKEFAGQAMRKAIIGDYEFDHKVFSMLISYIFRWNLGSPDFYDDLIQHLCNKNQNVAAINIYRTLRALDDAKISRPVLDAMLVIFCGYHSVQGMQQVLDDWFRWYEGPSEQAYRMCLAEFARRGDASTVHALFEQYTAKYDKFPRTADHFVPLLHVHAVRGELEKAQEIFDQIQSKHGFQQTTICHNILMNAYAKVKDMEGAFDCFEQIMSSNHIVPDSYTFGTMMGICASRGDREAVQDLFRQAKKENIPQTTAMVNCLVLSYIYDEEVEAAEKICDKALRMKLEGTNIRMWNYLLVAYAMRRDIANVNRVVQKMTTLKLDFDEHTYAALMQSLVMIREPDRAWIILKEVMPSAGIRPTPFHYAVVMGGFLATRDHWMVFHVYSVMTKAKREDPASTRLLLLKNTSSMEGQSRDFKNNAEAYSKAKELFRNTMKLLEPQDWAGQGEKGIGRMPLDIAYPAAFYGYMMFVLAKAKEVTTVRQMFDEFTAFLPGERRKDRPILIWSALMVAQLHEQDYEGVEQSWGAALATAEVQGSPSSPPGPSPQINNILYSHQLDLSRALHIYLKSLGQQRRINEVVLTVNRLQERGFALDNKNWNHYIQVLARGYRYKLAFRECEARLMPNWTGWNRLRWRESKRNRLPIEVRRDRKQPRHLYPQYRTLLYLARAFMELQSAVAGSAVHELLITEIEREFPKVVYAIKTMQRTDEPVEREVLRR